MKLLVLIDGNAIVHRAYHALPHLTTKDGKLVNAVYGFTSMLLKVINDLKPTHLAVAFDRPERTFREELFEDYQAQRPEMEDELANQFPIVKKVVDAMGIPIFEKAGYEADDVIGTLAKQATNKTKNSKLKTQNHSLNLKTGKRKVIHTKNNDKQTISNETMEVIIVTGDRDILQLVDDAINVYMPVKGLSQAKLFDIKAVEDKYGIKPSQVVDYKALVGDPSDNYKGVTGIGPKTAEKLLSQYKTLENLYKHLDRIDNKNIREKLEKGKESALMAKKLAKIVTEVSMTASEKELELGKIDTPEVERLFNKLEFKTLLRRMKELKGRVRKEEVKSGSSQLSLL